MIEEAASRTSDDIAEDWALDLRQPFRALAERAIQLSESLDQENSSDRLDLYLLLCALAQMVADHLHRDFGGINRMVPKLASRLTSRVRGVWARAARRELIGVEAQLLELAAQIVPELLYGGPPMETANLSERTTGLAARRFPGTLEGARMKAPHCFRDLDVGIEDASQLAARYADVAGDGPHLVLGIRTSGSYLAPAAVARLRQSGARVAIQTMRPGMPRMAEERRLAASIAKQGGSVLVIDEGVWWGQAMGAAHSAMRDEGFDSDRVWLGIFQFPNQPIFDTNLPPAARARVWSGMAHSRQVIVRSGEWWVEQLLKPSALTALLNRPPMLAALGAESAEVIRTETLAPAGPHPGVVGSPQRRSHVKARLEVGLTSGGSSWRVQLLGKGVGAGFFGRQSLILAERMAGLVPRPIGLVGGILFTEWVGDESLALAPPAEPPLRELAEYVSERRRRTRLSVAAGRPGPGDETVSRRAARVLSRGIGRRRQFAQHRVQILIEQAIQSRERSVIDGAMGPREWVRDEAGRLRKVDFEEHGFEASGLDSEDWLRDVADLVIGFGLDEDQESNLLASFGPTGPGWEERLLVYKLEIGNRRLQAAPEWLRQLVSADDRAELAKFLTHHENLMANAVNRYLCHQIRHQQGISNGQVWAVDLDGTLESTALGFPALTVAGVRAVRALQAVGATPLLCTGRALNEVADRCRLLKLPGGVAEYGGVIWDSSAQIQTLLLTEAQMEKVATLRDAALRAGFMVDPGRSTSVRVFEASHAGRRGIAPDVLRALLPRTLLEEFELIQDVHSTDLVCRYIDKGSGLRALLNRLGLPTESLHAIGDAHPDLPMMAIATHRFAPGNARPEIRRARATLKIGMARRSGGAGVLEIVNQTLVGPGALSTAYPDFKRVPLMEILALGDLSRAGRAWFIARSLALSLRARGLE